jgi:hypothetical protein
MKIDRTLGLIGLAAMVCIVLLTPLSAFAQNCALCYTQTSSAGARMIQALRSGILIMIIPPTLGSIGMIFIVHRKRNQFRRSEEADEFGRDW